MRIVVDTNIVFSAILNSNNRISRILLMPKNRINFYSTRQLLEEIDEHKDKLLKISKAKEEDLNKSIKLITSKIRFIDVRLISKESFIIALKMVEDVDIDDTEFIALTEHIKGKFWTGDKELKKGLFKKGWNKFVTQEELTERLKIS
jgi:predicted nucleic acid-binding protein